MTPRTLCLGAFSLVLLAGGFGVVADDSASAAAHSLRQAGWRQLDRAAHEEVWESPIAKERPSARPASSRVRVLGAGLNRWDSGLGVWVPAEARFDPQADGGFAARRTAHHVRLASNLNAPGAVEVVASDGQRFGSTPTAIAYLESGSGRTVLLAEVQDCRARLVSATEVLYANAFDRLADVRYTVGLDRFEQDVILRAAPPTPERFGLDPVKTRLVVLTEFSETSAPVEAAGETTGWLKFGSMALGPGKAFQVGDRSASAPTASAAFVRAASLPPEGVPVGKAWQVVADRTLLVETVEYTAVAAALADLPLTPLVATQVAEGPRSATEGWVLPPPLRERSAARKEEHRGSDDALPAAHGGVGLLAGEPDQRPGLVVDYMLLSTPNITLAGGTTYLVADTLNVRDLVIEGGAVVKYDTSESARLTVVGSVTCRTGPYRPAIFTHKFDATVGEPIATGDATASLVGYPMLEVLCDDVTLEHLRFRHAQTAVKFGGPATPDARRLRHVQMVRCATGVAVVGESANQPLALDLGNLLAAEVGTVLTADSLRASCAHLTADRVNVLVSGGSAFGGNVLAATNSVLVNVTNISRGRANLTGTHNGFWNSPTFGSAPHYLAAGNPFQMVGGGRRYLTAEASFRGAGTVAIDGTLLGSLRSWGTTQPPTVWTNAINDEVVWAPVVPRSQGNPDLGYHYEALDYAVSDVPMAKAVVTLTNGVALAAFGSSGLRLGAGARLVSIGTPTALNVFTRYNLVQEQSGSPWDYAGRSTILEPPRGAAAPAPEVQLRFARLSAPAYSGTLAGPGVGIYRFADCQFAGGELTLDTLSVGTTGMVLALENCLLEGVNCTFTDHEDPASLTVRNCTFWHGEAWFRPGKANTFQVRNTFFDGTVISASGGVAHDYNAYLVGAPRLMPPAPHDLPPLADAPDYVHGPLGDRYLPTACALRDAGSHADAAQAGLYHHTTSATDRSREENTRVDVGFHYVGCAAGQPADSDRDTLSDWLEDNNGNGALDSGETLFTSADTDPNDALDDRQTHALRFNVLVNDPRQDNANEQNSQWQPKVVASGENVVVAYWDSNQGFYGLASGADRGINRMVGWAVSRDGGVTFADGGQPPLGSAPPAGPLPWPPGSPLPWGDAGDPVLALDRKAKVIYFAGTSERRAEAFRGVPLWKSTDNGETFVRCDTVRPDIEQSDYPWIAVDDWPVGASGCFRDVYLVIRTLGPGTANMKLYLAVARGGDVSAANWTKEELAGYGATMQTVAVGPDHVAYVAWLRQAGQYPNHQWSLELRAVGDRGKDPNLLGVAPKTICELSSGPNPTLGLLRSDSGDANDFFKAFRHPELAINPARAGQLYVAFADRGSASDRADVFFTYSTDGGQTWLTTPQRLNSLDGTPVANDQWAPVLAVNPDGRRMLAAWFDRRNDPANSLMDVYGRWATIAGDGTVTWGGQIFRITTENFPPAYPGTLEANRAPGHYDPVWPPNGVTLEWWYDWWPLEFPPDDYTLTQLTYRHEVGEHNGAFGAASHAWVVWADTRRSSVGSRYFPERRQSDVRLARIPWPLR